jgi:hypothetical protein
MCSDIKAHILALGHTSPGRSVKIFLNSLDVSFYTNFQATAHQEKILMASILVTLSSIFAETCGIRSSNSQVTEWTEDGTLQMLTAQLFVTILFCVIDNVLLPFPNHIAVEVT